MALNKEIWIDSIVGNLFKDSSFLANAVNHSAFVNGKTVHVPNAGSAPVVTKNRNSFPASVDGRTDYDLSYTIDEFTTAPFRISNAEEVELSYDKRESIVSACRQALIEAVAEAVIANWVPSGYDLVQTTGSSTAHYLASQTGNRKAVAIADILEVKKKFDAANIPQEGRCALLDYEMYSQLLGALSASQANAFLATADASKGIVGTLYGFTFFVRSSVLRTVAAGTSLAESASATDQGAGLFWQKDCVSVAMGETDLFEAQNDPTYYGDIVSALVRAGGKYMRYDKKGVVVLAQATQS